MPKKEKRLKRYRSSCPAKLAERLQRATTQRLYLVESSEDESGISCAVLGSTGNVYQVKLHHISTCNCPDFHRKQDLCKHILFVLLKVIGLDVSNPLAFQKAYLSSELQVLKEKLRNRTPGTSILAHESVRAANKNSHQQLLGTQPTDNASVTRKPIHNEDCSICFDPLDDGELVYCKTVCGTNFHADCIRRWHGASASANKTCPNCRSKWNVEAESAEPSEGYTNLAHLQPGQSSVRPPYTPPQYKRRRYYY